MDYFNLKNGELYAEDVPLSAIADGLGTPAYVYSAATLRRHARVMTEALQDLPGRQAPLIAFAVKANSNLAVLRLLAREGLGADVVSGGEMQRALHAGIAPEKIVFSGVGKTDAELRAALQAGILQLNIESKSELKRLSVIAGELQLDAAIALRVNPDVDAGTHAKISTGKAENKFGIPMAEAEALYAYAASLPHIRPVGVATHIGSQLLELAPLEEAYRAIGDLVHRLRQAGQRVERVDLGGGLGVPYDPQTDHPPSPAEYGAMVRRVVASWPDASDLDFIFEPGRVIAGNAGVLLTRIVAIKKGAGHDFVVVDAAMNDLLRPALYDAVHDLAEVQPRGGAFRATIVGPVCETGDTFARAQQLGAVAEGDLLAFRTAGAYGAVMASSYNSRPLVPEVLVDGDRHAVVRPRQTLEELLGMDRIPEWLR